MSGEQRKQAGVMIGKDYPAPIVDHREARKKAPALFARVKKRPEFTCARTPV
jgi:deoxyribodipyrimidine photolyase